MRLAIGRKALPLALWMLSGSNAYARDRWVVVAPGKLDPRIIKQIRELAGEHSAEVRMFHRTARAARPPADLVIELQAKKDMPPEGYGLEVDNELSDHPFVQLTAAASAGFHLGLLRLPDALRLPAARLSTDLVPPAKSVRVERDGTRAYIADYPSFPERGIVEGFYGPPWSHKQRLDMLRFEGRHGLNVYYYAPKDDPYHRKLWQKPYPPGQMRQLKELVQTAKANFVDFCFAISPGLSMVYSSPSDFSTLTKKLETVGKLGVSCFALFLDDVPPELQHPQDQRRFKTLAQAHVDLINRLDRYLKSRSSSSRLVVTPTVYTSAWGSRDYIRELGAGTNPDVTIVWTGPKVLSPQITFEQAREWGDLLRRRALVWDNFPVNDETAWRLNLGPLRGRDPNLPAAVAGLFSNPMNQARASLLPLETVADYLWDAQHYDPERSYRKALEAQYGPKTGELLGPFLKVYGDYVWQENVFRPLFVEERRTIDLGEIERQLGQLEAALETLREHEEFRDLPDELDPFTLKTRDRLGKVRGDPAFAHLGGEELKWRDDDDILSATRLNSPPKLDGDFAKWREARPYHLDQREQIVRGERRWNGKFTAQVALAWDAQTLYLGVDVTSGKINQPFWGRGIDEGDTVILTLETAFRKNFDQTHADGDEYRLFFSPGNFAGVPPSIFSDEDYLPPRPVPRHYEQEIKTAWMRTPEGYSGDIAIPAAYFDGGKFYGGYEIGLSFAVQKVLPPRRRGEGGRKIIFSSKRDHLFPVRFGNPSSYQRLVLVDQGKP